MKAPSGGPLVQHALVALLEASKAGKITLEKLVEKACHNPAILFEIEKRGYLRENYYADIVLVDPNDSWTVSKENILYQCGWSPFDGHKFKGTPVYTIINGEIKMKDGEIIGEPSGKPIRFED